LKHTSIPSKEQQELGDVDRYSTDPGHRNWQIETAGWNCADFFTEGFEIRWQRFGQFLHDL